MQEMFYDNGSEKKEDYWDLWNVKSKWVDDQFCMSGKEKHWIKNDS